MDALFRNEYFTPLCSIYWLIKPTKNGKTSVTSISPLGILVKRGDPPLLFTG